MIHLLIASDFHYGSEQKEKPIVGLADKMISYIHPSLENIVIVAGDLTDHGFDGQETCKCLFPFFGSNSSCTGGKKINELEMMRTDFIDKIDGTAYAELILCHGNHDTYNGAGRTPVLDYIKTRFGNTHYTFQTRGIWFFVCGLYPSQEICSWIYNEMEEKKMNKDTPLIFIFHYNFSSNDWTEQEKQVFLRTIKYKHVLCIIAGHSHESSQTIWNCFPVFSGAGSSFISLVVDQQYRLFPTFING